MQKDWTGRRAFRARLDWTVANGSVRPQQTRPLDEQRHLLGDRDLADTPHNEDGSAESNDHVVRHNVDAVPVGSADARRHATLTDVETMMLHLHRKDDGAFKLADLAALDLAGQVIEFEDVIYYYEAVLFGGLQSQATLLDSPAKKYGGGCALRGHLWRAKERVSWSSRDDETENACGTENSEAVQGEPEANEVFFGHDYRNVMSKQEGERGNEKRSTDDIIYSATTPAIYPSSSSTSDPFRRNILEDHPSYWIYRLMTEGWLGRPLTPVDGVDPDLRAALDGGRMCDWLKPRQEDARRLGLLERGSGLWSILGYSVACGRLGSVRIMLRAGASPFLFRDSLFRFYTHDGDISTGNFFVSRCIESNSEPHRDSFYRSTPSEYVGYEPILEEEEGPEYHHSIESFFGPFERRPMGGVSLSEIAGGFLRRYVHPGYAAFILEHLFSMIVRADEVVKAKRTSMSSASMSLDKGPEFLFSAPLCGCVFSEPFFWRVFCHRDNRSSPEFRCPCCSAALVKEEGQNAKDSLALDCEATQEDSVLKSMESKQKFLELPEKSSRSKQKSQPRVVLSLKEWKRLDIGHTRSDRQSRFGLAAEAGDIYRVDALFEAGVDVDRSVNEYGHNALLLATWAGQAGMVQHLIKRCGAWDGLDEAIRIAQDRGLRDVLEALSEGKDTNVQQYKNDERKLEFVERDVRPYVDSFQKLTVYIDSFPRYINDYPAQGSLVRATCKSTFRSEYCTREVSPALSESTIDTSDFPVISSERCGDLEVNTSDSHYPEHTKSTSPKRSSLDGKESTAEVYPVLRVLRVPPPADKKRPRFLALTIDGAFEETFLKHVESLFFEDVAATTATKCTDKLEARRQYYADLSMRVSKALETAISSAFRATSDRHHQWHVLAFPLMRFLHYRDEGSSVGPHTDLSRTVSVEALLRDRGVNLLREKENEYKEQGKEVSNAIATSDSGMPNAKPDLHAFQNLVSAFGNANGSLTSTHTFILYLRDAPVQRYDFDTDEQEVNKASCVMGEPSGVKDCEANTVSGCEYVGGVNHSGIEQEKGSEENSKGEDKNGRTTEELKGKKKKNKKKSREGVVKRDTSSFTPGATCILSDLVEGNVLSEVIPRRGRLLLFPHDCPHEGLPVGPDAKKLLLRGEILIKGYFGE